MRVFAMAAGAIAACSSNSDAAPSSCADISGNYSVISARGGGNCDAKADGDGRSTVGFSRAGADWAIVMPGLPGGCPGTLDARTCKFIATCEVQANDGGATLAHFAIDYTFSPGAFSGSTIAGVLPPAVEKPCDVTYQEKGSKL